MLRSGLTAAGCESHFGQEFVGDKPASTATATQGVPKSLCGPGASISAPRCAPSLLPPAPRSPKRTTRRGPTRVRGSPAALARLGTV